MCATCVATGAAYVVPGLVVVKAWAKRRPKPQDRSLTTCSSRREAASSDRSTS